MYYKKRVSKFLFYSEMIFLLSALMQQDTDDNCSSLLFGSFPRSEVNDWNILCRRNLRTTANIPNAPRGEM